MPNEILVISGSLKFDDFIDGWRVTAKEVADIDRVIESRSPNLIIRWSEDDNGRMNADHLKQVLEPFRPGSCDISVFYARNDAQARVRLSNDWSVRPSRELREQLSGIVGLDGFRFIYNALAQAHNN